MKEIMTKENIGKELFKWIAYDKEYCYLLVTLASSNGLITPEEALIAKTEIDKYGVNKDNVETEANKILSKYMLNLFPVLGYTDCRILYLIIKQYIDHPNEDLMDTSVQVDVDKIIKIVNSRNKGFRCNFKFNDLSYYKTLNNLIKHGFVHKAIKGTQILIDFDKIISISESEEKSIKDKQKELGIMVEGKKFEQTKEYLDKRAIVDEAVKKFDLS
jgi:hypothetical protein